MPAEKTSSLPPVIETNAQYSPPGCLSPASASQSSTTWVLPELSTMTP